ncbi:MAG: fluoride efflux transporter CrcB [Betaproteobacteria bacterium]|nr:fluoride efflux transporter CrcB [Betaproteobacteria bacterium]
MTAAAVVGVGVGAALGAWVRWGLAAALNGRFLPELPLGTLAANVIGGFLIGLAMEWFGRHGGWSEELRLFVVTGFLGALTTFSTFSAEVVAALLRAHYGSALLIASGHLAGSLLATVAGIFCVRWLAAS